MSLESRLREVEAELAAHPVDEREPARVQLTFKGRPVVGTHGIVAGLRRISVQRFTDAITAMASVPLRAPHEGERPHPRPRPAQDRRRRHGARIVRLRAGDPAQGSSPSTRPAPWPWRSTTRSTCSRAPSAPDEELANSAFEIDERALDKVRAFLKTLADADAVCTMVFGDSAVRFSDVSQVKQSLARLGRDNLRETEERHVGELLGVLPKSRSFEFKKVEGEGDPARQGGPAVEDIDALNGMLHRPMSLRVMVTRVSRPPRATCCWRRRPRSPPRRR